MARVVAPVTVTILVLLAVAGAVVVAAPACADGPPDGGPRTPASDTSPCGAEGAEPDARRHAAVATEEAERAGAPAERREPHAGRQRASGPPLTAAEWRGPPARAGANAANARGNGPPEKRSQHAPARRSHLLSGALAPDRVTTAGARQPAAHGPHGGDHSAGNGSRSRAADAAPALVAGAPENGSSPPERDAGVGFDAGTSDPPGGAAPIAHGGVAVVVGALAAHRAGLTAGAAPDAVSCAAKVSCDVIPAGVRTVVELVHDSLPESGLLSAGGYYSRHDDSDPLVHDKRSALFDLIQQSPGVTPSSLAEEVDIPLSTARHHLRVLEREGLVKGRKITGKRRFVAPGTEASERLAAVNDRATARILRELARRGPSSVTALAEHLDRDPSTVTHHLKRLESTSLVVRRRDGRSVRNELTVTARSLLRTRRTGGSRADRAESSD